MLPWAPAVLLAASSVSAAPRIFYTDITSGPNAGGEDGLGCYVSLFGMGFGNDLSQLRVTVGGGEVARYIHLGPSRGRSDVQQLVVQLGPAAASGPIRVAVSGVESQSELAFTVRPGNIYFVSASAASAGSGSFADPWRSPAGCVSAMLPGDICYVRAGTYGEQYDGSWAANFDLTAGHGGAPALPIAYVGYPGESARFTGQRNTIMWHGSWKSAGHLVFASLEATPVGGVFVLNVDAGNLYAENTGAEQLRFVDIHVHDIADVGATGVFKLAGDGNVCLGNQVSNNSAPVARNLAHAFYPSNGLDDLVIAYNYVHDNDWGDSGGYEVSLHTDGIEVSGPASVDTVNAQIFANLILSGSGRSRGVGVGIVGAGSTIYIHDNIIATNRFCTLFAAGGSVYVHNNTLYYEGAADSVILLNGPTTYPGIVGGEIINNIIVSTRERPYFPTTNSFIDDFDVVSHNLYWGAGPAPTADAQPVNADPGLVAPGVDFHMPSTSPAIDAGATLAPALPGYDGEPRPQGAGFDIGAYELSACADVDGDGYGAPASYGCPQAALDCDDAAGSVHPGAPETCNGLDDDCNGTIDDGCSRDTDDGSNVGSSVAGGCGCSTGEDGAASLLVVALLISTTIRASSRRRSVI